jgi:AraC-like DNA-binding protein
MSDPANGSGIAHKGDGPVPHSVFDVSGLPAREAVTAWHEAFSPFVEFKLTKEPEGRFHMRTDAFHMGGVVLGTIDSDFDDHIRSRSRARAARDGHDFLSLYFHDSGYWRFVDNGEDLSSPGDVSILDMAGPHRTRIIKAKSHCLLIPRRLIAPLLAEPDTHNARILKGNRPLTALVASHVRAFHAQAPGMTMAQASAVLHPTLELVATMLNGVVAEQHKYTVELAATEQIRRFIRRNALDPSLNPEKIAAQFSMSPRKLYSLFEPHGGVMAYAQRERLLRVHAAIVDPKESRRTIQEIAEEHGFTHRKSFIRAFERQYGMTPREARAYAREGSGLPAEYKPRGDMWEWIGNLR